MEQYKTFAEEFIKDAGVIIRDGFFQNIERSWKEDETIVTEYDTRINTVLVERVQKLFPGHAVYGEESGFVGEKDAEFVWVCDPIDGTRPFVISLPHVTCMLSLTQNGEAILGYVYDPILDRIVTAEKGKGVLFNGEPCPPSLHQSINRANIAYSVSKKFGVVDTWKIGEEIQKQGGFFSFVNAGMSTLLLVSGNIDAIILPFFSDYEFITSRLFFEEAGMIVTSLGGLPIIDVANKKQGFVAARPELHKELIDLLHPFTDMLRP